MKLLFQQTFLNLLSLIGLGIVAALSLAFFLQVKQLSIANLWLSHTQQTIETTYRIMYDIYNVEASIKNYFLSSKDEFLNTYKATVESTIQDISQLKELTRDNKAQQERIQQLKDLFDKRISRINLVLQVRKTHTLDYTMNFIRSNLQIDNSNMFVSSQMLSLLQNITNEENRLLLSRRVDLFENLTSTTKKGVIVNIATVALILGCLLLLNRQLLIRFATENKLKMYQKQLEKLAYFDPLTGLNNRTGLIGKIRQVIHANKGSSNSLALLYLDLDNFKNINDNFGHEIGDQLLKAVAKKLEHIEYNDKFVARISGDEFVVLLYNIGEYADINIIAKNIFSSLTKPIMIEEQQIVCTLSMGICTFPENANDENSLIKNADIALYKAKQLGKNNYQYCTNEMRLEFEKHAALQHHLHQAVLNNEFTIVYQPKLSLVLNTPSGVEALIRWVRPNIGLTYPSEFITYAEKNGLIIPIGEWMVRTICLHAKKWRESGLTINVAINVSAREFIIHDFAKTLKDILQELDFDPKNLEIEITESILLENSKNNMIALQHLKSLGIQITIDDFGTGYSSLSYLNLLPIDKLKIDKSFISQITSKHHTPGLVTAIISLAHNLGIRVIAEGVETQFQFDFLKRHHCDEIQGYLYCKPLSSAKLVDFYKSNLTSSPNRTTYGLKNGED